MIQKRTIIALFVLLVLVIAGAIGYFVFVKKSITLKTESSFPYNEVIKNKIGINGGIMQNAEKSVIVTVPPLKEDAEFTLSFKKSNFEVKSGIGSPVTINISPDINLMDSPTPIKIKVKYDARYNLPVPYLVDEQNKLHSVDIGELDKENHYFIIYTFHGGDYSWIYATE